MKLHNFGILWNLLVSFWKSSEIVRSSLEILTVGRIKTSCLWLRTKLAGIEMVEIVEMVEFIEMMELVETVELVEMVKTVELVEMVETADLPEMVELVELAKMVELMAQIVEMWK